MQSAAHGGVVHVAEGDQAFRLGLGQFGLDLAAAQRGGAGGVGDGRVVHVAEGDFTGVLGLGQLFLHLLRGQARLRGDGGGVAFFAEGVLAGNLGLLQFGLNLGARRALVGFSGLDVYKRQAHSLCTACSP